MFGGPIAMQCNLTAVPSFDFTPGAYGPSRTPRNPISVDLPDAVAIAAPIRATARPVAHRPVAAIMPLREKTKIYDTCGTSPVTKTSNFSHTLL